MAGPRSPPANYSTPRFPSLNVHTLFDSTPDKRYTLYYIGDVWRFTVIWTLIVFALFHLGAVFIAVFTHGWKKSSWKYLWITPIVYLGVAGLEAVLSGTIVGVMLGAVYQAGYYEMNTWIPCTIAVHVQGLAPCSLLDYKMDKDLCYRDAIEYRATASLLVKYCCRGLINR